MKDGVKMKKIAKKLLFLVLASFVFLTGCNTNKNSVKYLMDNKDVIVLTVKSNDGYTLKEKGANYQICKDGQPIITGALVAYETLKSFMDNVNKENNSEVLYKEEGKVGENPYIYYEIKNANGQMEYNFLVSIMYSNTGAIMGSTISREAAFEAFKHLLVRNDLNQM